MGEEPGGDFYDEDGLPDEACPPVVAQPRRRRRRAEIPEPPPQAPAPVQVAPPTQQEIDAAAEVESRRREQAQRDLDAQPWFQKYAAKPTQCWHIRRDGPAKWNGKRLQTGICREPIRGKLTIDKLSALVGGGSYSVTSDDPVGPTPPSWYPIEELIGAPLDFELLEPMASCGANVDVEVEKIRAELGIHSDPEVEVYDPLLKDTIKVRKSLAEAVRLKNQAPPPASDAQLIELVRQQSGLVRQQSDIAKEQRETNAVVLKTLEALLAKAQAPAPAPLAPSLGGAADNPWKLMLDLQRDEVSALRTQLLAMQQARGAPAPASDPMAMIGTILGAAKDLAGLSSGGAGSTALSAIDKIVSRTADALGTIWPSVAGPFNAALWNLAWTAPFGGMPPPGGIPAQAAPQQITGPAGAAAPPAGATSPPAAPPVAAPAPVSAQEQQRMMQGIREAADMIGLMLEGKATPEDTWAKIRAVAPPPVLAQVRALSSPAHVQVAITNLAMMPMLADKRDALLQSAKRATGEAMAVAEAFIAVMRAP